MATNYPHLRNAPITEGVIDLHVATPQELDVKALESVASQLEPNYSRKSYVVGVAASISVDAVEGAGKTDSQFKPIGIRFHSRDEKYVALFRIDGFSLSRLAPYETWENLIAETRRLWDVYLECVSPNLVTRVATRFINSLQLPMKDGEDFEKFLTKPPQVPSGLPQGMTAFLQRVVINVPDLEAQANITQMLQGTAVMIDKVPVILDIDVYRHTELSPRSSELWDYLAKLREFKNRVFFESITKEAIELYR